VVQALEKQDGFTWEEDGVVYKEERIYVPNNKKISVRITESELQCFSFSFLFYFIFDLFSIFLFLELRVRVSDDIIWSYHMIYKRA